MASADEEAVEQLQLTEEQRVLLEVHKLPQWQQLRQIILERSQSYNNSASMPLHVFLQKTPNADHIAYLAAQSYDQGRRDECLSLIAGIEEAKEAYDNLAKAERELLASKDQ